MGMNLKSDIKYLDLTVLDMIKLRFFWEEGKSFSAQNLLFFSTYLNCV